MTSLCILNNLYMRIHIEKPVYDLVSDIKNVGFIYKVTFNNKTAFGFGNTKQKAKDTAASFWIITFFTNL